MTSIRPTRSFAVFVVAQVFYNSSFDLMCGVNLPRTIPYALFVVVFIFSLRLNHADYACVFMILSTSGLPDGARRGFIDMVTLFPILIVSWMSST